MIIGYLWKNIFNIHKCICRSHRRKNYNEDFIEKTTKCVRIYHDAQQYFKIDLPENEGIKEIYLKAIPYPQPWWFMGKEYFFEEKDAFRKCLECHEYFK